MDQFSSDKLNDIASLYESIHYGDSEVEDLNEAGQPGAAGAMTARNQRIQAQGQVKSALGQGKGIGLQSASGVGQGTAQGQKAFGTQLGGRQGVIVKGAAAGPNLGPRGGSSFTRAADTVNVGGQTLYKAQKGKDVVYLQGKGGPQLFKSGAKPPGRNPPPPGSGSNPPPGSGGNQPPSGRTQPPAGGGSKVLPTKPAGPAKPAGTPMDQWRAANPKLAAAADEKARIRGTQQTDNPLMKDMKSRLPMNSPSVQSPAVANLANKPTTLAGNQSLVNNPNAFKAAPPKPATPAAAPGVGQRAAGMSLGSSQFRPATTAQATAAAPSASPAASGSVVPPTNAIAAAPRPKPMVPARAPAGAPLRPEPLFQSYDYEDVYDLVLEYLITEGYADTEESATAIMANMSEEWRESIVEGGYNDLFRGQKKKRGTKPELWGSDREGNPTGKYSTMQHQKREAQRERDSDEQRRRNRDAMSRGTWDKN